MAFANIGIEEEGMDLANPIVVPPVVHSGSEGSVNQGELSSDRTESVNPGGRGGIEMGMAPRFKSPTPKLSRSTNPNPTPKTKPLRIRPPRSIPPKPHPKRPMPLRLKLR